jgi:DNA replication protein DnaC
MENTTLLDELRANLPPEILAESERVSALSPAEQLVNQCESWNQIPGKLGDYDCENCLNRVATFHVRGSEILARQCRCKATRISLARIRQSGLGAVLDEYTFENFRTGNETQAVIKSLAELFVDDCGGGKWLYAGGRPGAGKTHICTAIAGRLLRSGRAVRYMLWRDETVQLKAV